MKEHTRMEAHDGYVAHSHEVRPDHRGVNWNGIKGWAVYYDGELVFSCDKDKWDQIGPALEKIMESARKIDEAGFGYHFEPAHPLPDEIKEIKE